MNNISGIGKMNSTPQIGKTLEYGKIASGKKLNSAKDGASELAIANKILSELNGLNAGASNARDGQSVINIADGALGGITDSLQRIKELGIKASSGLNSASDKAAMQKEVDGLLEGIQQTASVTEFNTKSLLDGSMASMDLATNPDGTGMKIQMANSTLENLGIDGFDVRGNFDLGAIDKALEMVSSSRSSMGASYNALDYAYNSNSNTSLNLTGAYSNLADLDMPKAVSKLKQDEVLNDYRSMMLKKRMENENMMTGIFQ